jgi:Flp pilus assembly pilin Flp
VGAMGIVTLSKDGQNLIEYTLVVAIVSAALVAMTTYVFRSVQAQQKVITEEFQKE